MSVEKRMSKIENGCPILEIGRPILCLQKPSQNTVENRTSDFQNRTTDSVGPELPNFEDSVLGLRGAFLNSWRIGVDGQDAR